jgi:glycosyltransferase involved in cell wall biosynthesis
MTAVDMRPAVADAPAPFSILVPVHNEAAILDESLGRILRAVDGLSGEYEILVCENGSTDDTRRRTGELERLYGPIRAAFLPTANYGLALKHGITECRHDHIVIVNVDFWSLDFVRSALPLLSTGADVVIGSKVMAGSRDERPFVRRAITRSFNALLRVAFGFRGTDTHGLKALRKGRIQPIVAQCVTDRSLFDTELVLRAERAGLRVVEIPVEVSEIRQPGWGSVIARAPEAVWNLLRLAVELRRR